MTSDGVYLGFLTVQSTSSTPRIYYTNDRYSHDMVIYDVLSGGTNSSEVKVDSSASVELAATSDTAKSLDLMISDSRGHVVNARVTATGVPAATTTTGGCDVIMQATVN